MPEKRFLDTVYDLDGPEETREFYDDWSETYDAEVAENGYATPGRCAAALAAHVQDKTRPHLDIGCGTGVSGLALSKAGFTTIDGSDFSAGMLEQARAKGIYRNLLQADLTNPMPFETGAYATISAIGVLNPGHAPAQTLDQVMEKLPRGGLFVFSLNDHALAEHSYLARISEHVDCGAARLMFREHGPHLPRIGLESTVFVLEKA